MSNTMILRDKSVQLSDQEKAAATKALESAVRGIDDLHHKRWCRFIRRIFGMEHGEIAEVGTRVPRSGPFHRFHMAIEQAVFDAQDRFTDFGQFRNWLKIGAGHVTWVPGAKGGIVPLPNSISYSALEEDAMREFHEATLEFLRGAHAAPFLWRHLGDKSHDMMRSILDGFSQDSFGRSST